MHALTKLHDGGHIYKPGGYGELEYDIGQHLIPESIVETRDLPGFVLGNVTYESHHFWVHFVRRGACPNPYIKPPSEDSDVYIRVHHGGGWEVWQGDYMLAKALRRYGPDDIGLFLLCWFMIDAARAARYAGRTETRQEYSEAFIEGRLKKRKSRGFDSHKVWIEPRPAQSIPA